MLGNLLIVVLGVASLQVWAAIFRRARSRQPILEADPRCPSPWLKLAAFVAGVYVALLATTGSPGDVDIAQVQQATAFGVVEIAIALAFLTGGFQTRFRDVGFRLDGLNRQLADGCLAFLASVLPVFLLLLATYWLRTPDNQHAYLKLLRDEPSPANALWLLLAAVVVAPVREELLFRVMLQDGLARRIGPVPAIGIVAILFCLVHGFPDSIALVPLAVILGYVYQRTQSAISVIITHALFNLSNLAILLLSEPP